MISLLAAGAMLAPASMETPLIPDKPAHTSGVSGALSVHAPLIPDKPAHASGVSGALSALPHPPAPLSRGERGMVGSHAVSYAVAFDMGRARKGITFWAKLDKSYSAYFKGLKRKGYDHVGLVFAPMNWMEGKGGEVANFGAVRKRINEALGAGLLVVVRTTPWAMHFTEMFDKRDTGYFDVWLVPFARMIAGYDPNRVAWEYISEPGWFTRDTAKLGGDLDRQRAVATDFLHRTWAHTVPLIRRYAPSHTLFLGLPGWGHSYGANEHLLIQTGRYFNVVHYFHFYWPFDFVTDKTGQLDWPEPNWKQKLRGRDINTIDFGSDRQPWDQRGLNFQLDKLARWRAEKGVPIFITEMGPVDNKDKPGGKRYRSALEAGLRARNIPYSLWLG